jgi:hypothetical protein
MTTVTTMLFPPAGLVWGGVMLGAVIGGWLSVNLGNCDPVQEMLVAMPGGAIGVYLIEGGAIKLVSTFPAWWQNVWAAGKEFLTQGAQRLDTEGPETNITFGHGARHLAGTGLGEESVNNAISADIIRTNAGADYWGWIQVQSQWIQYRAAYLPDRVNVGTYVPVSGILKRD